MRSHLPRSAQDQPQPGLRRAECRDQTGWRQNLAGELYGLRLGVLRPRDRPPRQRGEPLRRKSVTHVSGINRYLCVRNRPDFNGGERGTRTPDQRITISRLSQMEFNSAFDMNGQPIQPSSGNGVAGSPRSRVKFLCNRYENFAANYGTGLDKMRYGSPRDPRINRSLGKNGGR